MHLTYENTNEEIIAVKRKPRHQPPHLHNAMEIVCVTKGTLELGVGQELYHMETGDIGVVFPDVIHHYQVFSSEVNEAVFINAPQMIFGRFENVLRNNAPQYPVVKSDVIPDEVYRAVESIIDTGQNDIWVVQAYLQIILARCIPMMKLVEKSKIGSAFIAIGVFVSATTENQFIAALGTIAAIIFLQFIDRLNTFINSEFIRKILSGISFSSRYANFSAGIFDYAALLYYISFTGVFLFLAVRVFEKRRWA